LKESFAIQTERLQDILESAARKDFDGLPTDRGELRRRLRLLFLFPLVEIAWADGRVTRRESDAILEVAAAYGSFKDDAGYAELLEQLTSRPIPQTVGRMWQDFRRLFENLSEFERGDIRFCLDVQTQFVAEQSSDNLMAFLRGERVCRSEQEALQIVKRQLETAEDEAQSLAEKRNAVLAAEKAVNVNPPENQAENQTAEVFFGESELEATLDDYAKLVPLIPLVKTAWAEGRVTRRERHLIFEAAARMGVKSGSAAHARLAEWLELHPTEEFYERSFEVLHGRWQTLDADEKSRRRYDLISDCTRIAEASGGAKGFPSGGAKICDEEIAVVKHIARKLDPNAAPFAH
jgi:uncharacterized tellurite resistance protein B-like protein